MGRCGTLPLIRALLVVLSTAGRGLPALPSDPGGETSRRRPGNLVSPRRLFVGPPDFFVCPQDFFVCSRRLFAISLRTFPGVPSDGVAAASGLATLFHRMSVFPQSNTAFDPVLPKIVRGRVKDL